MTAPAKDFGVPRDAELVQYLAPMESESVPTPAIVLEQEGKAILPDDLKRLVRSYVFGTMSQLSPTARLIARGGVLTKPFNKFFGHGAGECAAILNVDEHGHVGVDRRGWPAGEMDVTVALQQITILSDPTCNRLPEEESVQTLRKPVITAEDVLQFILDMERRNRPLTDGHAWHGGVDMSHVFLEVLLREERPASYAERRDPGANVEVWRVFWGS